MLGLAMHSSSNCMLLENLLQHKVHESACHSDSPAWPSLAALDKNAHKLKQVHEFEGNPWGLQGLPR